MDFDGDMKSRTALFSLLLSFGLLFAEERPNIMIFLVDDMGVMDTSVPFLTDGKGQPKRYPLNDFYRTPSMERLASQGIRFNQFYAMSVCSPTRISIMTGQNAARHRSTNWINPWEDNAGNYGARDWNWAGLKKGDTTLPGELRKIGYRTMHVGKAHFGPFDHEGSDPANLGFDINVAGDSFGAPGSYYSELHYGALSPNERRKAMTPPHLESYYDSGEFLTEALTLEAKKIVSEAVKDEVPFFLHFSHYAVHAPFESDPRFAPNYEDSDKPKNAKAFATLIEGMDQSLGDMLDLFDELDIADHTLIFFLGDNGSDAPLGDQHEVACAAPLRGKKGAHYEGGMRVPFIASWARRNDQRQWQKKLAIPADTIQEQVASVNDLFPTVLGMLGDLPEDHKVDGWSLEGLLTGRPDSERPETFLMHYPHGRHRSNYFTVWRDGDWKAVYHALPDEPTTGNKIQFTGGNYELFNLKKDPFESNNLADEEGDRLRSMITGMVGSLRSMNAVYPVSGEGDTLEPVLP